MADRYDVLVPRPQANGKTYFMKLGVMFRSKDGGDKFSIKLDALPLPNEKGEIWLMASVPLERNTDNNRAVAGSQRPSNKTVSQEIDDSIPF